MASIQCVVVTPEKTALSKTADFVALPLYDGEVGIGINRAPMIGRLGFGELRLRSGGELSRFYVDGGFVQVRDNQVSVLTNHAVPVDDLNGTEARKLLEAAQAKPSSTNEEIAIRDRLIAQARAQVRLATK